MKLISWNVNGIRATLKKGFMDFLAEHDPDILCLQETKAMREQVEIDLPQYEEFWNSATRKGYSGTAIFSKKKPIQVVHDFPEHILQTYPMTDSFGDANSEGRVMVAEFDTYFVATVYTPNAKDKLERIPLRHKQWDVGFLQYMKELETKKPVIFCGDLNVAHEEIDLARPKQNIGNKGFTDEERQGFSNFIEAGFVDTLRAQYPDTPELYTWWSHWGKARERNVGWRIDYVLVSEQIKNNVQNAFILPEVMGSDHCPVGIEFSL